MIRGLYTSASGMLAAQAQSEVVADNVANIKTPGYKEEESFARVFPTVAVERLSNSGGVTESTPLGAIGTGVIVDRVARNTVQGALQETGKATDLALIEPDNYFVVQTPAGERRYTRNGQFELSSQGVLQTRDGYQVLGTNGPLTLSGDWSVSPDGTVMAAGAEIDRLLVVNIGQENLAREGQSLYLSNNPGQVPAAAANIQVRQGALEGSNVDLGGQMVKMITVMRAYEANQKIIQTQDETLQKAVNEVGKVT